MTLTAWDIYWVTRLDEISIALAIVCFGCIAGLVVSLVLMTHPAHDRWFKPGKKICVTSLVVGCIVLGVNTLIPSTKQAAVMIVLPAIVNSEAVQQIPNELTTLAREWLQELRPAKKGGSK